MSATTSEVAANLTINTNGGKDLVFLDEVTTGSAPKLAEAFPLFGLLPKLRAGSMFRPAMAMTSSMPCGSTRR